MNIERIKETLIKHEDLVLDMYKCTAGVWTIGVGHNLEEKGVSKRVATMMLEEDINDALDDLERNITFFHSLPGAAQEALVNLAFNLGITRLMQFRKTLGLLREHKFTKAANELLDSRYATQVGYRALEVAEMIRSCDDVD